MIPSSFACKTQHFLQGVTSNSQRLKKSYQALMNSVFPTLHRISWAFWWCIKRQISKKLNFDLPNSHYCTGNVNVSFYIISLSHYMNYKKALEAVACHSSVTHWNPRLLHKAEVSTSNVLEIMKKTTSIQHRYGEEKLFVILQKCNSRKLTFSILSLITFGWKELVFNFRWLEGGDMHQKASASF